MRDIEVRRVYDASERGDEFRVLVDRLWPRGVAREGLGLDLWAKELAPSDQLRRWYAHDPARWEGFREEYLKELRGKRGQVRAVLERSMGRRITLLYAARDRQRNNAVVLREFMLNMAADSAVGA